MSVYNHNAFPSIKEATLCIILGFIFLLVDSTIPQTAYVYYNEPLCNTSFHPLSQWFILPRIIGRDVLGGSREGLWERQEFDLVCVNSCIYMYICLEM